MARTEEDVIAELEQSIQSTDTTLDVAQGPLPDIMIRPQAGQLAIASEEAESLRQLFTLDFQESATDDEVRNSLANYASSPGAGVKSRHVQHFLRFTRPTDDIVIPSGTLVSNLTGNLVYRVVTSGTITALAADNFYNPTRNAYELGLLVEAVGVGEDFNLPKFRVNTIVTVVDGIDTTENRSASTGGVTKETKDEQSERLKTALLGRNMGAPGGIQGLITEALPELVSDVATVQPYETEFTRLVTGPSLDLYNIGSASEAYTQTYTATGGETQLPLDKVPALSIDTLTVGGVSGVVTGTLVTDQTFESGLSLSATDVVVFDTPLILNDVVEIVYQYNTVLEQVQSTVFAEGAEYLFNTDILIRSPFPINPKIIGTVQALASFSTTEVEEDVDTFLQTEFTFTEFTETVFPEVIRQRMISEIPGVQNVTFTEFHRATGSLSSIEPIVFNRNEVSVYDASFVNLEVVS